MYLPHPPFAARYDALMSNRPKLALILESARDILSNPTAWTQRVEALDDRGHECSPYDNHACRYCASGAIKLACLELPEGTAEACIDWLNSVVLPDYSPEDVLSEWNDEPTTTHAMILAFFNRAITLARETTLA